MEEQEHRQHKKNEKLDKKRKKEKELKKIKKAQKKAYNLLKDEKKGKFFAQKDKKNKQAIKREKVLKAFKSFIKIYQDDLEDFFELFSQLDDSHVIETGDIEDKNIKEKLEKLMKKLKLVNKGTEQAPIFKKTIDIKLEPYVRGLYDEVVKGIQYKEESESSSGESESRSKSPQKQKEQQQKKEEKAPKNVVQNQKQKQLCEEVYQDKKFDRNEVRNTLYSDFEPKPTKKVANQHEEMDQFLESQFSKVGEKKLTSYLNDRKKVQTQPTQAPPPKNESIFLGSAPQKNMNPEEVREFMVWYDQTYRPKSLMEQHQEKLAQAKLEKQQEGPQKQKQLNQRKDFNRETDMGQGHQTSDQVMQQIRSGSLTNKFSQGHLQNSFI